jgi:hypothetical protein
MSFCDNPAGSWDPQTRSRVTKSNQDAPWLLFESGALAKSLGQGRVVPLFIDMLPTDIKGPLAAFQGRRLKKAGVKALVEDVNGALDRTISKERLDDLFAAMWPKLGSEIDKALSHTVDMETSGRW